MSFLHDLEEYQDAIQNQPPMDVDLRTASVEQRCHLTRVGGKTLGEWFPNVASRLNSDNLYINDSNRMDNGIREKLSWSSKGGYMEPLAPPMRHPRFCQSRDRIMDYRYMVHDFEHACRQLKPTSRFVLIDMGASLSYHDMDANNPLLKTEQTPIEWLLQLYKTFGIKFDHIYGFEATFTHPTDVYEKLLPQELFASYHWINTGVSTKGRMNPLESILRTFTTDDFVVIKLDIDTATLELPLVEQLLNDTALSSLVDQFYFEHHVHMKEMARIWRSAMKGTVQQTMELFYKLRRVGVPAHFWV
jgi:hypothetical protein